MLGDMASAFGVHDKPETTCIPQRVSAGAFQMLMGPSAIEGPGLSTYVVYLAADKCPNWVDTSCTLLVRTMDGYAVEAHFKTAHASSVDIIEAALTKKYKNAPTKGGESVCRNSATSIVTAQAYVRAWDLKGLYVSYAPISKSFNCSSGEIVVGTETFYRGQQQNLQHMVDSQPQM